MQKIYNFSYDESLKEDILERERKKSFLLEEKCEEDRLGDSIKPLITFLSRNENEKG